MPAGGAVEAASGHAGNWGPWPLLAFAALAAFCLHTALAAPFPHPHDELQHLDYAWKLATGVRPAPTLPLEPASIELAAAGHDAAAAWYGLPATAREFRAESLAAQTSYIAYHPPLYHWLAAAVIRAGGAAGLPPPDIVLLLRLAAALFCIAARALVWDAVRRIDGRLAAWALPLVFLIPPVDNLRIASDAPVHLLGAGVFWLLTVRGGDRRAVLAASALLAAGVLTKATATVFLAPAAAAFLVLQLDTPWRRRWRAAARLLAPAIALQCLLFLLNLLSTGTLTNSGHLAGPQFPRAVTYSLYQALPSIMVWLGGWNNFWMWGTPRGGSPMLDLRAVYLLATVAQVAAVALLAAAPASPDRTATGRSHRLGLAALGALFASFHTAEQAVAVASGTYLFAARQIAGVEGFGVLAVAAGLALLERRLGGPARAWTFARAALALWLASQAAIWVIEP